LSQQRQNNTTPSTRTQRNTTNPPPIKGRAGHDTTDANTSHAAHYIHFSQPPGQSRRLQKMLASTMQISNNNPTNTLTRHSALRPREEPEQPHHHPHPISPGRERGLILQDPTVCLTPSPTNVRQRVPDQCHPPHRADDTPGADDSTSEHHHRIQTLRDHGGQLDIGMRAP
jgi:hypothetical protein